MNHKNVVNDGPQEVHLTNMTIYVMCKSDNKNYFGYYGYLVQHIWSPG
jgi:hypothetical protein